MKVIPSDINDHICVIALIYVRTDFNECTAGRHACTGVAICVNDVGTYHCACGDGYNVTVDGYSCDGM